MEYIWLKIQTELGKIATASLNKVSEGQEWNIWTSCLAQGHYEDELGLIFYQSVGQVLCCGRMLILLGMFWPTYNFRK